MMGVLGGRMSLLESLFHGNQQNKEHKKERSVKEIFEEEEEELDEKKKKAKKCETEDEDLDDDAPKKKKSKKGMDGDGLMESTLEDGTPFSSLIDEYKKIVTTGTWK